MRVERSIDLPCPPVEVWDVLTEWERQADWMLDADGIVVRSEQRLLDRVPVQWPGGQGGEQQHVEVSLQGLRIRLHR